MFHRRGPRAEPRGQPLRVSSQSLTFSVPSFTLFFIPVKYDFNRSVAQFENPYAFSLFKSSAGCIESNALDMLVEKTPTISKIPRVSIVLFRSCGCADRQSCPCLGLAR